MKLPYGLSNFRQVATEGYTYIDRTACIARLEEKGRYHVLLRPRRFGKSLFLSMLEHYYDVRYKTDFELLFGKLYIGKHPTPSRNSYQVLVLDFSGIATDRGEEHLQQGFASKVELGVLSFLRRYGYPPTVQDSINRQALPQAKWEALSQQAAEAGQKIVLLIDEYDHFANALLAENQTLFQKVMGKGGFVRSFYETLKTATRDGVLDRLFITGVTPLMLDSLTSGFNISKNLSTEEAFSTAMGFTREETAGLLQPLVDVCSFNRDVLVDDVTRWYNGYRFHPEAETVYNPDMVLYFIDNVDRQRCAYPERMLDENIASDYRKIMALFQVGNVESNHQVLDELLNTGEVAAIQQRRFDLDKGFGRDDFISLLAYMGFVTIKGRGMLEWVYHIPNQVIRELYFQYFKVELEARHQISIPSHPLNAAVTALALRNDMGLLVAEMVKVLQVLSNRDALKMDEKHLKTLLLTLLYQAPAYFIQSEPEINHDYPDILLRERSPFKVNHQHLIELKYAKKGEGTKGWEAKRQDGITQVQGYLQLPDVAALAKLSAWLLVTDGERVEAVLL